ncbi:hypothetical protein CATMIT_01633, partial [Catenibacterium mitsuokai DSM 15897]
LEVAARLVPQLLAVGALELRGAEERMRPRAQRHRAVERGHRRAPGLDFGLVPMIDRSDALAHRAWRERAVLVVPAVGAAVGRGQVPLGQVDVLADHVGRRGDLVVVGVEILRHQVGVLVHRAVEGVHAQHQRLGRALAVDGRGHVFPQRQDALLRIVVAELVEGHIELDVGALVHAWIGRAELDPAGQRLLDRDHRVQRLAAEERAVAAGGQALAAVVDARLVVGRAGHRRRAVDDEVGGADVAVAVVAVGRVGAL